MCTCLEEENTRHANDVCVYVCVYLEEKDTRQANDAPHGIRALRAQRGEAVDEEKELESGRAFPERKAHFIPRQVTKRFTEKHRKIRRETRKRLEIRRETQEDKKRNAQENKRSTEKHRKISHTQKSCKHPHTPVKT